MVKTTREISKEEYESSIVGKTVEQHNLIAEKKWVEYDDLYKVLAVICDFHSRVDCVADLKDILPIANKHNIKLSIASVGDILRNPKDYDFNESMYEQLIRNID